jgi:hypothetical protein
MALLPEEHPIAGLLQELIARSGTTQEILERRLGWEPGRLAALLDGRLRLSFRDVHELLPLLGTTSIELLAWLRGLNPWDVGLGSDAAPTVVSSPSRQRALDRLFERSLRAVSNAVVRRTAAKRERNEKS